VGVKPGGTAADGSGSEQPGRAVSTPSDGGASRDGHAADPVTGALPRAVMLDRLRAAVEVAQRRSGSLAVCLFDVDYFKSVNDAYGHERGDTVLRQVVERIHALVRAEDELYRYGGDEFVLLLPRCTADVARELVHRVVDGVRAAPFTGSPPLTLSISMGVAVFPADGWTVEDLLRVADRRAFAAKREGRARPVFTDPAPARDRAPELEPVARLVEREEALAGLHALFAEVASTGSDGVLDVAGLAGAGRTRFLAEAATVARLRGFDVLEATACAAGEDGSDGGTAVTAARVLRARAAAATGLCVLLDTHATPAAQAVLDAVLPGTAAGAGVPVVLVRAGHPLPRLSVADEAVPVTRRVELTAWSPTGLRVWLRGALRTEPETALVDRILTASGGMPGAAEREVRRLVAAGALVPDPAGGWRPAELTPAAAAGLLGRDREVAGLLGLLSVRRLVTVVGTGGVGKTTVAQAVATAARGFPGGTPMVRLESARTPAEVEVALAAALEVTPAPGQELMDAVAGTLRRSRTLLVLDNVEQVLDAAPLIARLLETVPDLGVLATSRERLRLYGEQVFALQPLSVPDADALPFGGARLVEAASASPAVRLFCARAAEAAWDFSLTEGNARAVLDLCRRLDGLPLAIELAAARCGDDRPEEVLAGLADAVCALDGGPRDRSRRQQTLRAAIDWSLDLLDDRERAVFARLAAFPSSFDPAAAADVGGTAPAVLDALVDKNLLCRTEGRFTMLQVLRERAAELLAATGDDSGAALRHARHYLGPALEFARLMRGAGQGDTLARTDLEYANFRQALRVAVRQRDVELACDLAGALWWYWSCRGLLDEGRSRLAEVLTLPDDGGPPARWRRARLLNAAGVLATMQSDTGAAGRHLRESVELARSLDDPALLAAAVSNLATVLDAEGDYPGAVRLHQESLDLRLSVDDAPGVAASVGNLGDCRKRMGDLAAARALLEDSTRRNRDIGSSVNLCIGLANLGEVLVLQGDTGPAAAVLAEAAEIAVQLGDEDLQAQAEHARGMLAGALGAPEAETRLRRALELRLALREREHAAMSLDELALLAAERGAAQAAIGLYAAAAALRRAAGTPRSAVYRDRHEPLLEKLRDEAGASFAAAWTAGAATAPAGFTAAG